MADIVIDNRLTAVESDVKDITARIEEFDDRCIARSDRYYQMDGEIRNLKQWRDGNGARGAEARLQGVEHDVIVLKECLGADKTDAAIERIAAATAKSIVANARSRDRTVVEKVKAVSSILSPILAALAVVIAAVIAAT